MKNIEKLQTLLPLGYIFLVILGIIKESLYYYQLGINIIPYSSIMDILISPIATITSHPVFMISIILVFAIHYKLPQFLLKYNHKKWVQKAFELKNINEPNLIPQDEIKNEYIMISIRTLCSVLISLFLGFGFGGGYFLSKKIKKNELKYEYRLNYNSGESEDIFIINSNSVYYFYLAKGNKAIKITPVNSIKNIELIKNKMLTK